MSPLLGEIKRGGETILSSPVGEGWKGWGTFRSCSPQAWGVRGAESRTNLYRK